MKVPGESLSIRLLDLIDKLGSGIFSPGHIKRTGRADNEVAAERIVYIAQAEKIAEQIKRGEVDVLSRPGQPLLLSPPKESSQSSAVPPTSAAVDYAQLAFNSAAVDQIRKDINVAKAIIHAERELEGDSSEPPQKEVDEDWLHRWREAASSTSNSDIQEMWGRLLAGEVKNPGSFSLRTLDVIKNLSHAEAIEIQHMAQFIVSESFVFREGKTTETRDKLSFAQLLNLAELGVISGVEAISMSKTFTSVSTDNFIVGFPCYDKILVVEGDDPKASLPVTAYVVTKLGQELARLCAIKANENYLNRLGKHISEKGFKVSLADITVRDFQTGSINFNNEKIIT